MNRQTTCLLCGITSNDVSVSLVAWIEPVGRDRYGAMPRCKDVWACRGRVESTGERWDVRIPERSTKELVK